jgi:hypothetical protein
VGAAVEFGLPAKVDCTPQVKPPNSVNERTALTETGDVAFMDINLLKLPVRVRLPVSSPADAYSSMSTGKRLNT